MPMSCRTTLIIRHTLVKLCDCVTLSTHTHTHTYTLQPWTFHNATWECKCPNQGGHLIDFTLRVPLNKVSTMSDHSQVKVAQVSVPWIYSEQWASCGLSHVNSSHTHTALLSKESTLSSVVRIYLRWRILCCVLRVGKGKCWQCPDLILLTLSQDRVWKQYFLFAAVLLLSVCPWTDRQTYDHLLK